MSIFEPRRDKETGKALILRHMPVIAARGRLYYTGNHSLSSADNRNDVVLSTGRSRFPQSAREVGPFVIRHGNRGLARWRPPLPHSAGIPRVAKQSAVARVRQSPSVCGFVNRRMPASASSSALATRNPTPAPVTRSTSERIVAVFGPKNTGFPCASGWRRFCPPPFTTGSKLFPTKAKSAMA